MLNGCAAASVEDPCVGLATGGFDFEWAQVTPELNFPKDERTRLRRVICLRCPMRDASAHDTPPDAPGASMALR